MSPEAGGAAGSRGCDHCGAIPAKKLGFHQLKSVSLDAWFCRSCWAKFHNGSTALWDEAVEEAVVDLVAIVCDLKARLASVADELTRHEFFLTADLTKRAISEFDLATSAVFVERDAKAGRQSGVL